MKKVLSIVLSLVLVICMMPVMAWLKLDLHTASVTRFDFRDEFDSGYATARCSYINDISHLKAAGLAEQKE